MSPQSNPIITQPGTGQDLHAFGNVLSVMLSGEQTSGLISVMSESTPPGGGPPLHVHSQEDEIFLVIEGRVSYFVNGQWTEVGAGGLVFLPRGCEHCFRNIGNTPSRHWIITFPSGFEKFFASCAQEFARQTPPDMQRIVEVSREYGIEFV